MSSVSQDTNGKVKCRAGFVQYHGQKASLMSVTPNSVASALFKLYPLLIICDCILNNVLWITDDLCLPLIHLVAFFMAMRIFDTSSLFVESKYWDLVEFSKLYFNVWVAFGCAVLLICSALYYIQSVYQELYEAEQPTLDDIVILLETVSDKLDIIRRENLRHGFKINNVEASIKAVLLLTPIHLLVFKFFDVKTYAFVYVMSLILYHSVWFQATFQLLWRIYTIRRIYFWIHSIFYGKTIKKATINMYHISQSSSLVVQVPFSKSLKEMEQQKVRLFLKKLYPKDVALKKLSFDWTSPNSVNIIEISVHENQRKWNNNNWLPRMLPFERGPFSIDIENTSYNCLSPWELEKQLPENWFWLDNSWSTTDWKFSDTNWDYVGSQESLEAYTRSRFWKRRLYCL